LIASIVMRRHRYPAWRSRNRMNNRKERKGRKEEQWNSRLLSLSSLRSLR
jgi:hypothetical protein